MQQDREQAVLDREDHERDRFERARRHLARATATATDAALGPARVLEGV